MSITEKINRVLKWALGTNDEDDGIVYLHVINDNRLPGSTYQKERKGPLWQYGRCYLTLLRPFKSPGAHVSWCVARDLRAEAGWRLHLDDGGGDDDLNFSFWGPGFHFGWGVKAFFPEVFRTTLGLYKPHAKLGNRYHARTVGISAHDGACWVDIWRSNRGWSTKDPKWWSFHFSIDPRDLLGRKAYSEEVIQEKEVDVPMPEGTYRAKIKLQVDTWTRPRWPRWPFTRHVLRAHMDMIDPIPFPGKGENSWDCGSDALHGQCAPAKTIEEAIGGIVETVLRSRQRYGGSHRYTPDPEPQCTGESGEEDQKEKASH